MTPDEFADMQLIRLYIVNCRRQKMKCVVEENDEKCRRCVGSGLPCVFVPRVNAANLPEHILSYVGSDSTFREDVLHRLRVIEEFLGLPNPGGAVEPSDTAGVGDSDEQTLPEASELSALFNAVSVLEKSSPSSVRSSIWERSTIEQLWSWLVLINRRNRQRQLMCLQFPRRNAWTALHAEQRNCSASGPITSPPCINSLLLQ